MNKKVNAHVTNVEHEAGEPVRFIFPYRKKDYPYLLQIGLTKPLTANNCAYLFDLFPKALITETGCVIIPRTREEISSRVLKDLEELECLGIRGIAVTPNQF